MLLLLASSNPHKAAEFRRMFQGTQIDVRLPSEIGVSALEVPEHGVTFLENATTKAEAYMQAYRMATLADDSGIRVDALAGAPGVQSARFGRPEFDDEGRVRYLLDCMQGIPDERRGAHYVCEIVIALPEPRLLSARGLWYGRVATEPSAGTTGFGYDPVFKIPSLNKSVAELTPQDKDASSHRGKAVRMLLAAFSAELRSAGTLKA
jgi:XTP/dITP diphosphohydrolase